MKLNYKLVGKALLALSVNPLLLIFIKHRKFWTFFWITLFVSWLLIFLLFSHSCIFNEGMKLFYSYNEDKIRVIEDDNFLFYKEGYTANYKLNSKYYLSHRILLIPESKLVPVEYVFDGKMLIELYDKSHQLLYSFEVDHPENLLRQRNDDNFDNYLVYPGSNTPYATSLFAFELGKIPFDLIRLKWSRLKNMEIKVTVLKPDKDLLEFCDKAALVVIPDLRL